MTPDPDRIRELSRAAHPFIKQALALIPGAGPELVAADEYLFTLLQIPGALETLIAHAEQQQGQAIPRFPKV